MRIMVFPGETMLGALQRIQVNMDAPCGGNGTCGRCEVMVYGIGKVKACQFCKPGMYEVTIPKQTEFDAVTSAQDHSQKRGTEGLRNVNADIRGAVVDIGTTTVAVRIFADGDVKEQKFTNPQRRYGADVMSRIRAAVEGNGEKLQKLIAESLQKAVGGASPVIISANTTMQHLLEGLSCAGLGAAPFQPVTLKLHELDGSMARMKKGSRLVFLPGISTFVGADIVSGIYACGMTESEKISLFLDLGTNGEMAIGNSRHLFVASASAGPAFEGSELAQHIYGSGIMKALRQMLTDGVMDETGLLADPFFEEGYPVGKENAIRMTQDDIRDIQMAKAAIHAGVQILLKTCGIHPVDVDKVYLAGGMGYYLNPEDAIAIGLLPKEFEGKIQAVGNSSLDGAECYLANPKDAGVKMEQIVDMAEEVVLAEHPLFQTFYMDGMNFPAI